MNSTSPYNYGPINIKQVKEDISDINETIEDISETIGNPTNPETGTIYGEIIDIKNNINDINSDVTSITNLIGTPSTDYSSNIFNDLSSINTELGNLITKGEGVNFPGGTGRADEYIIKTGANSSIKIYVGYSQIQGNANRVEITNNKFQSYNICGLFQSGYNNAVAFYGFYDGSASKDYIYVQRTESTTSTSQFRFIAIVS